jgi:Tfp pilus assembly protein PilN
MIQFNLLPDVKKQYIHAKKTKRLIISTSFIVSAAAVAVVVMFVTFVQVGQKKYIDDLTKDINKETASIHSIDDLDKMLTVQNQLTLLPGLHEQKPETSRLFDYLSQLISPEAPVSSLSMDMADSGLDMTGSADSIATINKLIDTFKAVTYTVDGASEATKVFTVNTSRISGDNTSASYRVSLTFDPMIFDNTKKITLSVNGSTTPATTETGSR